MIRSPFVHLSEDEAQEMMKETEQEKFQKKLVDTLSKNKDIPESTLFWKGTTRDEKGKYSAYDLRVIVCNTSQGFKPLGFLCRTCSSSLAEVPKSQDHFRDQIVTNISKLQDDGEFRYELERYILFTKDSIKKVGLSTQDFVEAYFQAVFAHVAIEKMAQKLITKERFNIDLFRELCPDETLLKEVLI
mmetsp:Transcript_27009/g.23898  ORF Transcript_27009/g.23898 Transcript_27009/m.23898 type:complete len:188 (+) Transcript_27009:1002-1565(+)